MAPSTPSTDDTHQQLLLDTVDLTLKSRPFRNPQWKPSQRRNKNIKQTVAEAARKEASVIATHDNSGASTPNPQSSTVDTGVTIPLTANGVFTLLNVAQAAQNHEKKDLYEDIATILWSTNLPASTKVNPKTSINVSLLATNRLVNHEAVPVLYQMHRFDFARNVRRVAPFLLNISKETRQNLRGMWMELHDFEEPDHCCGSIIAYQCIASDNLSAWSKASLFMAENTKMKELNLTTNIKISADFRFLT